LLVLTMVLWGSGNVVARAVHQDISTVSLTFWRWAIALVILWPFVRRQLVLVRAELRRHRAVLALLSLCMVLGTTLSVGAVHFTTATNATLINATQPAVTALVAWLIARERLSWRQAVGVAFALGGILVMVFRADLGLLARLTVNIGDVLMFGAVVAWACYAVGVHRAGHGVPGALLLFVIACVAVAVLLPALLLELAQGRQPRWQPGTVFAVVYLGIGCTVLAVYLWNLCIAEVGANRAAVFVNLIPVSGVALAIAFLGERLALHHMLGAVLVFIGILLAVRRGA